MTELLFAKSFLTTLDSKPTKIHPNHVEDPKTYPARSAYILPKMPKAITKKITPSTPSSPQNLTITLKSLRNPPLDITLPSLPLTTSILSLKQTLKAQTSIPISKLRLLYSKKPIPDSKILKDLLPSTSSDISTSTLEFSVMVIGGAAAIVQKEKTDLEKDETVVDADEMQVDVEAAVPAAGISGKDVLATEEFWADLKAFLVQRLKDEKEGEMVWKSFRGAVS